MVGSESPRHRPPGTVEAPEALFGVSAEDVQAHIPLIHPVVTARSWVTPPRGTPAGKKPWKQKGTIEGSPPLIPRPCEGGRVIQAPQEDEGPAKATASFASVGNPCTAVVPRRVTLSAPQKMKAAALRYALSVAPTPVALPFSGSRPPRPLSLAPIAADKFTTVVLLATT